MTVFEICTIVLQATIAVGLLIYGVWFRDVVKHQLAKKDSEIDALKTALSSSTTSLEAVIKLKDTEIERLRATATPAIVKEHADISKFADWMTEKKQELEAEVERLSVIVSERKTTMSRTYEKAVREKLWDSRILMDAPGLVFRHWTEEVGEGVTVGSVTLSDSDAFDWWNAARVSGAPGQGKSKAFLNEYAKLTSTLFKEAEQKTAEARDLLAKPPDEYIDVILE